MWFSARPLSKIFSPAETPARAAASLALCALLLSAASCTLDGKSRASAPTPAGSGLPPRTSLPMPPVERMASQRAGITPTAASWTMRDGRRASLGEYRGQAVVLDFYATYCPPCLEEIPHLNALQRRYGPQGLNVIGLNAGGEEDQQKVPAFVERLRIAYPLGNPDPEMTELFLSDNTSIPQTYVFDRQGRLVRRFIGYDASMPPELEEAVRTALGTEN